MTSAPQARVLSGPRAAALAAVLVPFLSAWEGYAPVAVHEKIDPAGVITVCFGRTNYDDPTLKVGQRYTKAECQKFLADDLPRYEQGAIKCVPGLPDMPTSRQAALVSFDYNEGEGNLCKSSVAKQLNAGNITAGCDDMMLYVIADGKFVQGLQNRRAAERALCLKDQ